MPLNAIWEKHKKFLLTSAGGLAVFLILILWVQSYRAQADSTIAENTDRNIRIEKAQRDLDLTYDREVREKEVLSERLQNLLAKVSLKETRSLRLPDADDKPSIDFASNKDRIWSDFEGRADRINMTYPSQSDVDFDLNSQLTAQEWEDRYHQLEILKRVLGAAVDLRIRKIESITPGRIDAEPIPGAGQGALVRTPVKVKLHADFSTVLGLYERFQKDGEFMGVELEEITREAGDEDGIVRGTLNFVGLDVGEVREVQGRRSGRGARGGWGGRGRR